MYSGKVFPVHIWIECLMWNWLCKIKIDSRDSHRIAIVGQQFAATDGNCEDGSSFGLVAISFSRFLWLDKVSRSG